MAQFPARNSTPEERERISWLKDYALSKGFKLEDESDIHVHLTDEANEQEMLCFKWLLAPFQILRLSKTQLWPRFVLFDVKMPNNKEDFLLLMKILDI